MLAGLGGFLAGCVPTAVYPFYQTGDLIQDPDLLGSWKSADGKSRWTFTSGQDKSYKLELQADDLRVVCVAHLFKLGNGRFLDLYPEEGALGANLKNNPYNVGLIPAHVILMVRATSPTLRMSSMGMDWLKQQINRDPKVTAHLLLPDGRVVLSGETGALQAFIRSHINDADAWNGMYEDGLMRVGAKSSDQ